MENAGTPFRENTSIPKRSTIILAGSTGELGGKIAGYLIQSGAIVKALVRRGSKSSTKSLNHPGIKIIEVDYSNADELVKVCVGGTCFISAVSGLHNVIVGVQNQLLQAAVAAGIPRFIPSDYCIDYTKLAAGSNRNLDFRREFNEQLNKANISATSILNGMFTELLTGQAPVILKSIKRIMYWGNADQPLDFTTIDNTAAYTAAAALDTATPRYLRVVGEVATLRDLQRIATETTGHQFKLLRLGGLGGFRTMIGITRTLAPQKNEIFPAWQGMQYLHNMFSGLPKLQPLNNDLYPSVKWTSIREVLETADT